MTVKETACERTQHQQKNNRHNEAATRMNGCDKDESAGAAAKETPQVGASLSGGEDGDQPQHRSGTCKWFNVLKGFGFIVPDDGGEDVFVHQSVLKMPGFRSLDMGEKVEFQSKKSGRGWEATSVTGPQLSNCQGSSVHPLGSKKHRKIRCFNCGQYGNHVAAKCKLGPLAKSCYNCKATDHLVADCPTRGASAAATATVAGQRRQRDSNNTATESAALAEGQASTPS